MTASTASVSHYDRNDSFDDVIGTDGVVIVDFHAEWCGPCKQMEPVLEAVAESTDARVVKVDVDQHQQLASEHQVRGVPTLQVYQDGELVKRLVGYQSEPALRELIDELGA